jgi:hypothetical protein
MLLPVGPPVLLLAWCVLTVLPHTVPRGCPEVGHADGEGRCEVCAPTTRACLQYRAVLPALSGNHSATILSGRGCSRRLR